MRKLLPLVLLLAVACGQKEDPTPTPPAPTAAFDVSRQVVETGEAVSTTNTSTNAATYEWRTDDGQLSTLQAPVFTFARTGSHTISLTATNQQGQFRTTSQTVVVGTRYFRLIEVLAVPFTTPAGQPWAASGPNLRVDFTLASSSLGNMTVVTPNLAPANLPIGHTTAFSYGTNAFTLTQFPIQKAEWRFTLNHMVTATSNVVMATLLQDMTAPSANRDKNGNGWYELSNTAGNARLRVHYETRVQ